MLYHLLWPRQTLHNIWEYNYDEEVKWAFNVGVCLLLLGACLGGFLVWFLWFFKLLLGIVSTAVYLIISVIDWLMSRQQDEALEPFEYNGLALSIPAGIYIGIVVTAIIMHFVVG